MVFVTRSRPIPSPPRQTKLGVALQPEDVDPQLHSPLYDGTIPPEIRKRIFEYAMAEYIDPESYYPTNTDYTRPNFLGKKQISINLLLMCKRSYLETRHLPPINKTHVFWYYAGPPDQPFCSDDQGYFRLFTPAQLVLVKEVHIFTQQFWLEGSFLAACSLGFWQGIEKMKITLRRGDWWSNEHNAPLAITPQRPGADLHCMKEDWRREKVGEVVKWNRNCWGSAFRFLMGLKELEMEFETYAYNEKELDEIVRHAVMWKFPMENGKVLMSIDGVGGVKASSWRGPPCGWGECPKCSGRNGDCKFCEEMREWKMEGKGPMLIVRSLRWKLADAK